MKDLFFELVGPNYTLAKAEILSTIEGLSHEYEVYNSEPGLLSLRTTCPVRSLNRRLGLTHSIYRKIETLSGHEKFTMPQGDLELPTGSAAVRTKKIERQDVDTQQIKEKLGDMISEKNPIDLDNPDHEIYVLISDNYHIGQKIYETNKKEFRAREAKNRPFFSPISLKPRYTRALINLSRPGKDARIHDPFCGTGGVLIEAFRMGFQVSGGDKDTKMIEGCKENLREFEVEASLEVGDVSETIPKGIDRIVTDPPYGRASSTLKEDLGSIYERFFETSREKLRKGGYLSAIFPGTNHVEMGKEYLDLVETYKVRVHRSLDRHFTVFRNTGPTAD
ncbi:MAG: methyltransferase [Candidatus Natronoplasma sp.]